MLTKIKLLLGIGDTSKDTLLTQLIDNATNEAIDYTHNDEADELESTIIAMVMYSYSRLGTEGVNSENYSGISFSYATDYPDNVLRMLKAHRKIRTL